MQDGAGCAIVYPVRICGWIIFALLQKLQIQGGTWVDSGRYKQIPQITSFPLWIYIYLPYIGATLGMVFPAMVSRHRSVVVRHKGCCSWVLWSNSGPLFWEQLALEKVGSNPTLMLSTPSTVGKATRGFH